MMNDIDQTLPDDLKDVVSYDTSKSSVENGIKPKAALAGDSTPDPTSQSAGHIKTKRGKRVMKDNKELEQQVRATVESLLSEKDAQTKVEAAIKELETEKADATARAEKAEANAADLSTKLEAKETELTEASAKTEALSKDVEDRDATIAELNEKLEKIEAAKILEERTAKLAEANLLLPEGEARDAQVARAAAFDQEGFDAYVSELTAIAKMGSGEGEGSDEPDSTSASADEDDEEIQTPDLSSASMFSSAFASAADVGVEQSAIEEYAQM